MLKSDWIYLVHASLGWAYSLSIKVLVGKYFMYVKKPGITCNTFYRFICDADNGYKNLHIEVIKTSFKNYHLIMRST